MMRIGIWILVLAFGLTSYSKDIDSMPRTQEVQKETIDLIRKKKFEEASQYITEQESKGPWCSFFNGGGRCYPKPDTNAPNELREKLERARKCLITLEYAKGNGTSQEASDNAINSLASDCDATGFYDLPESETDKLQEKMIKRKERLPRTETSLTGKADPRVALMDKCDAEFKWTYEVKRKKQLPVKSKKFASYTDCAESKLQDSNAGYAECVGQYFGPLIKIDTFKTTIFIEKLDISPSKYTIHFLDKVMCEDYVKNGNPKVYLDFYGKEFAIAPKGSKEPLRFMDECKSDFISICNDGTFEVYNERNLIF